MLSSVIYGVVTLFCSHEWARRRDAGHVYLECVHCLATTRGIDFGPIRSAFVPAADGPLEAERTLTLDRSAA
jgi:hypothetical protein